MKTEFPELAGEAAALIKSVLMYGVTGYNRAAMEDWWDKYQQATRPSDDPEHQPIEPTDPTGIDCWELWEDARDEYV